MSIITDSRNTFHHALVQNGTLSFGAFSKFEETRIASNADSGQKTSVQVANRLLEIVAQQQNIEPCNGVKKKGQTLGNEFEDACALFLQSSFLHLGSIRPGNWIVEKIGSRDESVLGRYEQYNHLTELSTLANEHPQLKNFLGDSYTVAPDVVIARLPEPDVVINAQSPIVDSTRLSRLSMLRRDNHRDPSAPAPLLHASISCKFTMRSDRAQNTRTEALNLLRSRKGHSPHIISVTAEPMPSRIASLALGTGDLDCVYHFALYELIQALTELDKDDPLQLLNSMVEGKRLKDISDLPLDLAI